MIISQLPGTSLSLKVQEDFLGVSLPQWLEETLCAAYQIIPSQLIPRKPGSGASLYLPFLPSKPLPFLVSARNLSPRAGASRPKQ